MKYEIASRECWIRRVLCICSGDLGRLSNPENSSHDPNNILGREGERVITISGRLALAEDMVREPSLYHPYSQHLARYLAVC